MMNSLTGGLLKLPTTALFSTQMGASQDSHLIDKSLILFSSKTTYIVCQVYSKSLPMSLVRGINFRQGQDSNLRGFGSKAKLLSLHQDVTMIRVGVFSLFFSSDESAVKFFSTDDVRQRCSKLFYISLSYNLEEA